MTHMKVPSNIGSRSDSSKLYCGKADLGEPRWQWSNGRLVGLSFPSVRLLVVLRLSSRSELADFDVAMLDIAASRSLGESTAVVTVHNRILMINERGKRRDPVNPSISVACFSKGLLNTHCNRERK